MENPGIERYILLTKASDGEFRVCPDLAGPAHLGVVRPGHQVLVDEHGLVSLRSWEGEILPLKAATKASIVHIQDGFYLEHASWLQVAVRNIIWGHIIPVLVVNGQDVETWQLRHDPEALGLYGPDGHVSSINDPSWWKVEDPDVCGALAGRLLQAVPLPLHRFGRIDRSS